VHYFPKNQMFSIVPSARAGICRHTTLEVASAWVQPTASPRQA